VIGKAPTTQIRMLVGDALAIATAAKYFTSATWVPAESWLLFVLGFAGVAAAQWYGKRTTEWRPNAVQPAQPADPAQPGLAGPTP
jgi:membrane-bound lytic murein transglycosylase B